MFSTKPCKIQRVGGGGEFVSVKRMQADTFLVEEHDRIVQGRLDDPAIYMHCPFTIEPSKEAGKSSSWSQLKPFVVPPIGFTGDPSSIVQPTLAIGGDDGKASLLQETSPGTSMQIVRGHCSTDGYMIVAFKFEGDGRFLCFDSVTRTYLIKKPTAREFPVNACFKVYEMPNAMANPQQLNMLIFVAASSGCVDGPLVPLQQEPPVYEQKMRDDNHLLQLSDPTGEESKRRIHCSSDFVVTNTLEAQEPWEKSHALMYLIFGGVILLVIGGAALYFATVRVKN